MFWAGFWVCVSRSEHLDYLDADWTGGAPSYLDADWTGGAPSYLDADWTGGAPSYLDAPSWVDPLRSRSSPDRPSPPTRPSPV